MGFAARGRNGLRRSRGSDSGRMKTPYRKFANERTAAAQNGARRSIAPRRPPIAGPTMNPIPNAAPSMPKRAARFSGGVTSATYAPEMLNDADVAPETRRPLKGVGNVRASGMHM